MRSTRSLEPQCVPPLGGEGGTEHSPPAPRFLYLQRLTGMHGLWEHAHFTTPRREHGYCTDDNARALIVACRQPEPSAQLVVLAGTYLDFIREAQLRHGGFHNRRSSDGRWVDKVGSDDSQGRALWALGSVARRGPTPRMRELGLRIFEANVGFRSVHLRANAFAILGAAEVVRSSPGHASARRLLERCAAALPAPGDDRWPWPEERLAYDNARIPEALIVAGALIPDARLVDAGIALLEWLVQVETRDGHFSFAPVGGWAEGEARPGFDQQPVEAAAMADAGRQAGAITGDRRWNETVDRAARWFVGVNDNGAVLYDAETGGCRDGLTRDGANQNQGAESTLAALSTLQQARTVGEDARFEPSKP